MAEPDVAVHDLLGAEALLGTLSGIVKSTKMLPPFDGNLLRVPELSEVENVQGKAIFVIPGGTGEGFSQPFLGSSTRHEVSVVSVVVRSEAYDYDGGLALAQAVRGVIDQASPSGYYACAVAEPKPVYAGRDERFHFVWTMSAQLRRTF